MVCGVLGCDRWWMSPSRQCSLRSEAASELSVPTSSAGRPGGKEGRVSSAGRKMKRVIALKGGFTEGNHLQPQKRGHGQGCGRRETGGGLLLQWGRCSPEGWTQLGREDRQEKALFQVMGGWAGLFPDFKSLCVPRCAGTIPVLVSRGGRGKD